MQDKATWPTPRGNAWRQSLMSYAQKAIERIRELPQDATRVYLWEFPKEDFAAYLAMPDTPRLESHGHYLAAIAAIQADVERRGTRVLRVRVSVAAVIAELAKHNWPNEAQHRATVIGELGTIAGIDRAAYGICPDDPPSMQDGRKDEQQWIDTA